MEGTAVVWIVALETVLAGALHLFLPRIARHGLLFGVYIGEERVQSEVTSRIRRAWSRTVLAGTVVTVALQLLFLRRPPVAIACLGVYLTGLVGLYLWAYLSAKKLALPASPPPPAVAILEEDGSAGLLPHLTLVFAVVCSLLGLAYAAAAYPSLPAQIPTHFGFSGAPDAWNPKSPGTVLLLPILGVIQAFGLGLVCVLVSHAKRALRLGDGGASLRAQLAFRRAVTRFVCGVTWIVSVMFLLVTVFSIRTAQGTSAGIPIAVLALAGLMILVSLGSIVVLGLRYGQGGARLEGPTKAPLTDGLADNRYWVLGMFYVNPSDPSVMVERRFGIGYTVNLGNWKVVAGLAGFLLLTLGVTLLAVL